MLFIHLFVLPSSGVLFTKCKFLHLYELYLYTAFFTPLLLLPSILIPLPEYISANIFPKEFFKLLLTFYWLFMYLFSKSLCQTVVQRYSNRTKSGIKLTVRFRYTLTSSVLSDNRGRRRPFITYLL